MTDSKGGEEELANQFLLGIECARRSAIYPVEKSHKNSGKGVNVQDSAETGQREKDRV